jgi:hypothetical protein
VPEIVLPLLSTTTGSIATAPKVVILAGVVESKYPFAEMK